jgi:hypothetical protein
MTQVDPPSAQLAGIILLLLVALLVADGVISARGRYDGDFWAAERDRKIEHIAEHPREWIWMGIAWVLMLAVMTTGMSVFSVLLGQRGESTLAAVGLGSFVLGAVSFLVATFIQVGPSGVAARVRSESGATPGWLEPLWIAASWAEMSYIMLTSLAYLVWGVGMVNIGFPATWAGWASMAVGGLSVVGLMTAPSRVGFPQLPLVVPIVLGIALVIG